MQGRGGGVTSVISDIKRAAAKTAMMGVVTIRRDTIAVVSGGGAIASCNLITRGAGKDPATANDTHCLCLGIKNDNDDRCSRHHTLFNSQLSPKMQQSSCYPPPCRLVFTCQKRGGDLTQT